jgi:hypothetical protein
MLLRAVGPSMLGDVTNTERLQLLDEVVALIRERGAVVPFFFLPKTNFNRSKIRHYRLQHAAGSTVNERATSRLH